MNDFKKWLTEKYLPRYTRMLLQEENEKLKNHLKKAIQEKENLQYYANGLERALQLFSANANSK